MDAAARRRWQFASVVWLALVAVGLAVALQHHIIDRGNVVTGVIGGLFGALVVWWRTKPS